MTLMPVDKINPCCEFSLDPVMIVTLLLLSVMMTGRGGELVSPPHHLPHTPILAIKSDTGEVTLQQILPGQR